MFEMVIPVKLFPDIVRVLMLLNLNTQSGIDPSIRKRRFKYFVLQLPPILSNPRTLRLLLVHIEAGKLPVIQLFIRIKDTRLVVKNVEDMVPLNKLDERSTEEACTGTSSPVSRLFDKIKVFKEPKLLKLESIEPVR
jgi:hypothetical protein